MGAVTALLLILSPVWKRRFRPQWRCWAWLLVALRLAVPFNVSLPRAPVVLEAPAPAAVSAAWVEEGGFQGVELTARTLPPGEAAPEAVGRGLSLTTAELAFAVWAAVAAGVLAARLLRYAAFRRRTARWCTPAGTYEGVPVYACALLSSPALTACCGPASSCPRGWRRSGGPLPWPMRPCTPAAGICGARPCCCGCVPSTGSIPWSGYSAGRRSGIWRSPATPPCWPAGTGSGGGGTARPCSPLCPRGGPPP